MSPDKRSREISNISETGDKSSNRTTDSLDKLEKNNHYRAENPERSFKGPNNHSQSEANEGYPKRSEVTRAVDKPQTKVEGFQSSHAMDNEKVREHLNSLPKEHREGIKEVRYIDKHLPDKVKNSYKAGEWNGEKGTINVYRQTPNGSHDIKQMKETITHEIGHNVYDNMKRGQSEAERERMKEWDNIHKNHPEGASDRAKEKDSRQFSNEDFAYSYSDYKHHPSDLKQKSPERYDFMHNKVFENDRHQDKDLKDTLSPSNDPLEGLPGMSY